jgi:acyl CoA:acetate/3-ketoacid CoA transferase alpha subunit
MNSKVTSAAEALAEVRDGALVAFNFWGPGTPLHLLHALKERGVKDLTVCTNNYILRADVLKEQGATDPAILLPQTKKIIVAFSSIEQDDASASDEPFR